MQALIDYRNAKYQGEVDEKQARNGYGILIDDDLSFYASHWSNGKLNNDTVIYISHGKYIYGQWQNNQPHGLNVFRIADTVVLGEFEAGYLKNKILVIFEKLNFVSILQQIEGDWLVCQSGVLKNYNQLIRYITDANIPMKPQYFSLTKFLTSISNVQASAVPCKDSENCYYGFQQGLGIIFNPNNGVVSIGCHAQKRLIQFGGKYQYPKYVLEGNFQTNQVIRYSNERPKQQIYSIFHKIHKRSLNFKNEYFDSKVKLLNHIQELIRTKINEILIQNKSSVQQNTFTAHDLNDSLDYHAESLEEFNKMNKVREEVYEVKPLQMKKATSQYAEASPNVPSKKVILMTPKKNTDPIVNAPVSPIVMKKSPIKATIKQKQKEKEKEKQVNKTPTRHNYINRAQVCQFKQQTFGKLQMQYELRMKNSNQQNKSSVKSLNESQNVLNKSPSNSSIKKPVSQQQNMQRTSYKPKYSHIQLNDIEQDKEQIASSKNYIKQKEAYNVPSFNYEYPNNQMSHYTPSKTYKYSNDRKVNCYEKQEVIQQVQRQRSSTNNQRAYINQGSNLPTPSSAASISKTINQVKQPSVSPVKSPSYENLSQRRRRILNSFKNLNQNQGTINKNNLPNLTKLIQNSISSKLNMVSQGYNPLGGTKAHIERKQKQTSAADYPEIQQLESPYAREKFPSYESKNTERGQVIIPLTINKQNMQPSNWRDKNREETNLRHKLGKQPYFRNKDSQYKQNYQIEPATSSAAYLYQKKNISNYNQKKISEKTDQKMTNAGQGKHSEQLPTTPTRKVYKYYFDQENE